MAHKDIFLLFTLFIFIYQPPFLPVSLIYLVGPVVCVYVYKRRSKIISLIKSSHLKKMTNFFILLTAYLVFINIIDLLIMPEKDVLGSRIRCINQLLVLSLFQFAFVAYMLFNYKKKNYTLENTMDLIVKVGLLQGVCSVLAFLVPPIRTIFIKFGDSELFTNSYFLDTRGYGFSMTLIDTFGYGMGLIAGYIILFKWRDGRDWFKIISLALILFSIAVNARTGILVFLIALTVKALYTNSIGNFLMRIVPLSIFVYFILLFLPSLLEAGAKSENQTISWICFSFSSIFEMMQSTNSSPDSIEELDFLSNFVNLPSNPFELMFGTGHYVYDTKKVLGFRTDIGYFNMFWEFGVVGSFIILIVMLRFMIKPFFMTKNASLKRIVLFNTICYFVLLVKAILIGFNPGVFVNYLVTFTLYYYLVEEKRQIYYKI